MSGQYPSGYTNPIGNQRGHFNPQQSQQQQHQQQQQQQPQIMSPIQMGASSNIGIPSAIMNASYNQGGNVIGQQQQMNTMQGMPSAAATGVMNPISMQSASHLQQLMHKQQQQQQQQQMQQQMSMIGQGNSQVANMLQQQQQQMQHGIHIPPGLNVNLAMMNQQQHHPQQSQTLMQQVAQHSAANQLNTQQHQQSATNNMLAISQQTHKEINIVTLSRVGQETVQDITSRFQEIFAALKNIQPTANRDNNTVKKVQEHFRTIRLLFKRMRLIYERCNDGYLPGMEQSTIEHLIQYKDEPEHRLEITQTEEYRKTLQENQELIDTVKLKNRQLREIIDRTRIIVWEINTMLSMRRS